MERTVYITYDEEADVLYAKFGARTEHMRGSRDFGGMRFVEFDGDGKPTSVEFLDASHGIDLEGIPHAEEIRAALQRLGGMLASKVHAAV